MIKNLLVSDGGGIISAALQAEQKPNTVTLAIGLGGTGIDALRALKREVYIRVRPDNAPAADDAFIPRYDHIRFLAVDSDHKAQGEPGYIDHIPDNDFLDLSRGVDPALPAEAHILRQTPQCHWLSYDLQIDPFGNDARSVRQIGRLLLMQKCQAFVSMVMNALHQAMCGLPDPDINIHIFTGLAGGAGSGIFLDVCYILQHVLQDMALAGRAFTCGYFFLPDVNAALCSGPYRYLYDNGIAAMKELDYAMNFDANNGRWKQVYPGFEVDTQEPPVKLAHLIGAQDIHGVLPQDPYNYAVYMAAGYVTEFIIEGQGFGLQDHIAHIDAAAGNVPQTAGAAYRYCLLGAAAVYVPCREILTYLAGKIFEGFAGTDNNMPALTDAESFVHDLGLTFDDIEREIDTGKRSFVLPPIEFRLLQEMVMDTEVGQIPPMLQPLYEARQSNMGEREKVIRALLDTEDGQRALTAKVKQELIAIASDPAKGPYYAAALLKSVADHDLDDVIAGMIAQSRERRDQARRDRELTAENWERALTRLKTAGIFIRRSAAEEYVNAVAWWFRCDDAFDKYDRMAAMLTEWRDQISDLSRNFFAAFCEVITELRNTFAENMSWLGNYPGPYADYAQQLVPLTQLQPSLDASVQAMDVPLQIRRFIADLIREPSVWQDVNDDRIGAYVRGYFSQVLSDYALRTIDDYLEIRFNTNSVPVMTQNIYSNIITPLAGHSAPRFRTAEPQVMAAAVKTGFISYPRFSAPINNAVGQYLAARQGTGLAACPADTADRISVFRLLAGVPMFAYQGIREHLQDYKYSPAPGRHLYEGSDLDPRNGHDLPDIIPHSRIPEDEYNPEQKAASDDYDEALKLGIIVEEPMTGARSRWYIMGVDVDFIAWGKAALERAVALGTPAAIADAAQRVKDVLAAGLPGSGRRQYIPNTGAPDHEANVLKDHVVGSLGHMQLLREQLAIVRPFMELLAEAEEKAAAAGRLEQDVKAFAEALGAGAVRSDHCKFTYTGSAAGFNTEMTLSDIDTQPYGHEIPLYSAFLGFCALDADERACIAQAVKSALIGDEAALRVSANAAKAALSEFGIGGRILPARRNYPAEEEKIKRFFRLLDRELDAFIACI